MEVEVRYFAAAREATGRSAERVTLAEGATLAALRAEVGRRHPALARLAPTLRVAVDERFAPDESEPLAPEAVVALLPPVSGG
jgi:molybdopterin converting factor subunit 1